MHLLSRTRRALAPIAAVGVLGLLLAGCGASAASDAASPAPIVSSAPAEDPYAPVPVPGRTIAPTSPSDASAVHGWRLAVVVPDDSQATETLRAAVSEFADDNGVDVTEFVADDGGIDAAFADALAADADAVVGLGEGTSDVFAFEASQWLDRQFLIIGAQVAEPTGNVTAVIWDGATSRGSGAPADGEIDDASAPAHASDAIASGLSSVAEGTTGVVVHLGE